MQLYSRTFVSILDSSIADNWMVRHVFEDMLKLQDNGILDITREAFSRRTNTPLDVVNSAIEKLESPDPQSRDKEEEGRRIIRLDAHRDWGWRIVNWSKYEAIKTRTDAANRQRRFRQQSLPIPLPTDKTTDLYSDTDSEMSRTVTQHNATVTGEALLQRYAEEIYEIYPRKVAKPLALKAIIKALKTHGYEKVKACTVAYAESRKGQDQQFTPYPSTFFNQQRYNDDPKTWGKLPNQAPQRFVSDFDKGF